MPKVSEIYGSRFLKADHFNGHPRRVVVANYAEEIVYGQSAYVVYFDGVRSGLRLNTFNAQDIAKLCGDEMADWVGHTVELYSDRQKITDRETKTEKLIDLIRVRSPGAASNGTTASTVSTSSPVPTSVTASSKPPFDDEIPF